MEIHKFPVFTYRKPNTSPAIKANTTLEKSRCTREKTNAEATMAKPAPYFRREESSTPRKANSSMTGTSTAVESISRRNRAILALSSTRLEAGS